MIPILDTHLHLLYPDRFTYDWCKEIPALNKPFHLEEYQELIEGHGMGGSLFMEVDVADDQVPAEVQFFTERVKQGDNPLVGIIASCRPENEDFEQLLDTTLTDAVRGLRRILHVAPDELSQGTRFRNNVRSLAQRNLPFDICMLERQLPLAYDLAKSCPDNQFILNHCGIPTITSASFENWKKDLQQLATLPHVACKMSGVIAYCPGAEEATLDTLRPWLETTVETFGTDRIVLGSDWPVCNLTRGLPAWLTMVREFFATYSEDEQHAIFHRNTESIYHQPALA